MAAPRGSLYSPRAVARRKKKKRGAPEPAREARPKEVGTSLKSLLADVRIAPERQEPPPRTTKRGPKPPNRAAVAQPAPAADERPSETLRGDDRIAWHDAFAGVRPVGGKRRAVPGEPRPAPRPAPATSPADDEARDRLAALVAGGVRFELERDGDELLGRRAGTPRAAADALRKKGVVPEATLDLHGFRAADAEREAVKFVRAQHRRGARRLCIVHGKGLHSDGGAGVLRECVVHALTEGGAAPVVLAFASAPATLGGTGALLVELTR